MKCESHIWQTLCSSHSSVFLPVNFYQHTHFSFLVWYYMHVDYKNCWNHKCFAQILSLWINNKAMLLINIGFLKGYFLVIATTYWDLAVALSPIYVFLNWISQSRWWFSSQTSNQKLGLGCWDVHQFQKVHSFIRWLHIHQFQKITDIYVRVSWWWYLIINCHRGWSW